MITIVSDSICHTFDLLKPLPNRIGHIFLMPRKVKMEITFHLNVSIVGKFFKNFHGSEGNVLFSGKSFTASSSVVME